LGHDVTKKTGKRLTTVIDVTATASASAAAVAIALGIAYAITRGEIGLLAVLVGPMVGAAVGAVYAVLKVRSASPKAGPSQDSGAHEVKA
jgi:hypothetical protein